MQQCATYRPRLRPTGTEAEAGVVLQDALGVGHVQSPPRVQQPLGLHASTRPAWASVDSQQLPSGGRPLEICRRRPMAQYRCARKCLAICQCLEVPVRSQDGLDVAFVVLKHLAKF